MIYKLLNVLNRRKTVTDRKNEIENLETNFVDDHKAETAQKYDSAYTSKAVKLILDKINEMYDVQLTPLDLRLLSGQESRDNPNPEAVSSMGAVGVGQVTKTGLKGAIDWATNKASWSDEDKKMLTFFNDEGKARSLEDLKPERKSTTLFPQFMAGNLGDAISLLGDRLKTDKLSKHEQRMLIFVVYNKGGPGFGALLSDDGYKWEDVMYEDDDKLRYETKGYIGGTTARIPVEQLMEETFIDLTGAFGKQKTLPERYTTLINTEALILRHNNFETLPEGLKNLTKLKKLDLSHNSLKEFDLVSFLSTIPSLEEIQINGNEFAEDQITSIKNSYPNLEVKH